MGNDQKIKIHGNEDGEEVNNQCFVDNKTAENNLDDGSIYMRWINEHVIYGMFPGKDLEKRDVLL
ncbi:4648_t:CDS:2 [Entrophospora sp. SA101]|nr:4648_t:CDS:2 [Entrophospora sp. SA101]